MSGYVLGCDIGTTGTKTVLFSSDGKAVKRAYRSYPTFTDGGISEQNAADLWTALCMTVREAVSDVPPESVGAISLSTQGGTLIPVGKDGEPVRRAIVWSDRSCARERELFLSEIGGNDFLHERTGWRLVYGLPLLQVRRLRDREPDIFRKCTAFLSVHDYISLKLTGRAAVDMSNAGINELCDIRTKKYDPALLSFAGISENMLAEPADSGDVIGSLTESAAKALGLTVNTVLAAGAHDQYAASLGAGMTKPGDVLVGSGTSWAVTALTDRPDFSSGLPVSRSAVPGMWGTLTSLSYGGACLDWLRKSVLTPEGETPIPYKELDFRCAGAKAAEKALFFRPFGEKGGGFCGLGPEDDRYSLARAVMEGVTFEAADMLDAFACGDSVIFSGGASGSRFWTGLLADITGKTVLVPEISDLACVGAGILAGCACGMFSGINDGCRIMTARTERVMPDPESTEMYAAARRKYRKSTGIPEV